MEEENPEPPADAEPPAVEVTAEEDDGEDKAVVRRKPADAAEGEGDAAAPPADGAGQIARASKQFQIAQRFSKSFTSIRSRRSLDSSGAPKELETGMPVGFYYNAAEMEPP